MPRPTLLVSSVLIAVFLTAVGLLIGLTTCNRQGQSQPVVDIDLPSLSTGDPSGTLAVRVHAPGCAQSRYDVGAPVLIWVPGGYESEGIDHGLPPQAKDMVIITFLFPGGDDQWAGRSSDGTYDYRGDDCIMALRDVIRYAAGELTDDQGRTIDEVVSCTVLHDNIGLIGPSNGGNVIVAAPALYGDELAGHLRYIIQWETPVSSQVATRDFGRVWLKPSAQQGDYFNPRYSGYGSLTLGADYSDLAYDASSPDYQVFHDGNSDGTYTTTPLPGSGLRSPDLDLDGVLTASEDFPLDYYIDDAKQYYSRPVTHALADNDVFGGVWPEGIATPAEADAFWDIREAVRLYDEAVATIPDLQAMVLAGERDHVQSAPDKLHIHQAMEGWLSNGVLWVQLNPDPSYLIQTEPALEGRTDLPPNAPNTTPTDWEDVASYCVPEDIDAGVYQLAAAWQMADRIQRGQ